MTNYSSRHNTKKFLKRADGGASPATKAFAQDPSIGPTGTLRAAKQAIADRMLAEKQVKATFPGAKTTSDFQREQGEDIIAHVPHKRGGKVRCK